MEELFSQIAAWKEEVLGVLQQM
jgi:hypothetical protein